MSDQDDIIEAPDDDAEDNGPDNFFIDILTGNREGVSARKLLVQKVLRQLIESYGFDRNDLEVDYKHRIKGGKPAKIDIAIFRPGTEHNNDNLQRIVVCKTQKKRDKLRSITEADTDLREPRLLAAARTRREGNTVLAGRKKTTTRTKKGQPPSRGLHFI